uniref:WD_REPEATS_REGION domain-containing protein n=1 Tax=Macrostomum lignano TaxID=282301 RepID=A0A1I8HI92_9PLAT
MYGGGGGNMGSSDAGSLRSRTMSLRSLRIDTDFLSDGSFLGASSGGAGYATSVSASAEFGGASVAGRHGLVDPGSASPVPTSRAEASRALAGNTTTAEQYAFAGVYCILDQHCQSSALRLRFANNDRTRLAAGAGDGRVSVSQAITDLAWSSGNDFLLSVSEDGSARVWNVAKATCLREVPPFQSAASADAHHAAGGSSGSGSAGSVSAVLAAAAAAAASAGYHQQQRRNEGPQPLHACDFIPSNNNLFVIGGGKTSGFLRVVNLSTGLIQSTLRLGRPVRSLSFDTNEGRLLWAGDLTGLILAFLVDPLTGHLTRSRTLSLTPAAPLTSLQARSWISREARDPCLLATCSAGFLLLFRVMSGEGQLALRRKFCIPSPTRAAFCPLMSFRQGACVVCASSDTCVYIVDVTRERRPIVNKLQGHASPVTDVTFNYDESLLASADASGTII